MLRTYPAWPVKTYRRFFQLLQAGGVSGVARDRGLVFSPVFTYLGTVADELLEHGLGRLYVVSFGQRGDRQAPGSLLKHERGRQQCWSGVKGACWPGG